MASKKVQEIEVNIEISTDLKHYKNSFMNSDKYSEYKNIIAECLEEYGQYTEQEVINIIKQALNKGSE